MDQADLSTAICSSYYFFVLVVVFIVGDDTTPTTRWALLLVVRAPHAVAGRARAAGRCYRAAISRWTVDDREYSRPHQEFLSAIP